jgi:hypothetical protein
MLSQLAALAPVINILLLPPALFIEYTPNSRGGIFKLLRSLAIDSKESILPAYLAPVGNLSPAMGRGIDSRHRVWIE